VGSCSRPARRPPAGCVAVQAALAGAGLRLPPVAGHADWESQNLRWHDGRPLAVHDWDSAVAQPEPVVAGLAAAVWPATGAPRRGRHRRADRPVPGRLRAGQGPSLDAGRAPGLLAAGLWVWAFNAKKQHMAGGVPDLDRLAAEVPERAPRAGLDP
jgi:hypothetical protein